MSFPALKADKENATVEVKDAKGTVHAVKAINLSEGDVDAVFEFETKIADADLTGVWTVEGKEYSFDAIKQLADIVAAVSATNVNEVTLLNALNAAGIENVDENKLAAYATEIKDADPESLTDVQKAVDAANEKSAATDADAEKVKAVVAAENQVQLLKALQANFERVNADWNTDYNDEELVTSTKLIDLTEANATAVTAAAIQSAIDDVNTLNVTTAVDEAADELKAADVSAARELNSKYIADSTDKAPTDKALNVAKLDVADALVDLNTKATSGTNSSFEAALNTLGTKAEALNKLDSNADKLVTDDISSKNIATYKTVVKAAATADKNTVAGINTLIGTGNTQAAASLIDAVNDATTADALLKALKAYPGLKQVADSNKDFYWAETPAAPSAPATKNDNFATVDATTIQAAVDTANKAAIDGATTADKLLVALKVLELKNVVDANKANYYADLTANASTIKNATDAAEIDAALKTINEKIVEDAQVEALNKATTASEAKTALAALKIADFTDIKAEDKEYVASKVLEAREATTAKKFADKAEVVTVLGTSTDSSTGATMTILKAYQTLLTDVATPKNSTSAQVTALEGLKYEAFTNATDQAAVAEYFASNFSKDKNDDVIPYTSLAEVKAAVDAAIEATK